MLLNPLVDYPEEFVKLIHWFFRRSSVKVDNFVFFLHYNVSVGLLLASTLIVTVGLYISDPIECTADSSVDEVIDSYCWVHSTFTLPAKWNSTGLKEFPHPGVGPLPVGSSDAVYHGYYQWVCYILAIQAALFYIPKCLWDNWEGKRVQMLMNQTQSYFSSLADPDVPDHTEHELFDYFLSNDRLGKQNSYFWKLVFCEFLNLISTVSQILVTNFVLGFSFSEITNQVSEIMSERNPFNRNDRVAGLFPSVTKCLFNTFGPSGDIQTNDALCVLPFNVIHEKIYILMWFWLIFLAGLTSIVLCYRILLLFPSIRVVTLRQFTFENQIDSFSLMKKKLKVGDWFLLTQLGRNLDIFHFTKVVDTLLKKLTEKYEYPEKYKYPEFQF